jgi:hypothetical protein
MATCVSAGILVAILGSILGLIPASMSGEA